jgi:hypothetical protein
LGNKWSDSICSSTYNPACPFYDNACLDSLSNNINSSNNSTNAWFKSITKF